MSEVSGLSKQYETLSSTSGNLNESIILFKKKQLLSKNGMKEKYPKLSVSQQSLIEAHEFLMKFLEEIKIGFENESNKVDFIPPSVFKEYREKLEALNPFILEEIPLVLKALEQDKMLKKEHFKIMENLLTALDFERTMVFKKLRAGRT